MAANNRLPLGDHTPIPLIMDLTTDLTGIPVQYQIYATWLIIAGKFLAELYSSVRGGGGLKRIITSFWFGEQLPKPVAEDYKEELAKPVSPK